MYHNFIGIDISKDDFVVACYGQSTIKSFANTKKGFVEFSQHYESILKTSLVVLETTGGYEMALVYYLLKEGIPVHRADAKKVKFFIRSWGKEAKSDGVDARGLSQYGYERHPHLNLYQREESQQIELQQLLQRRLDINQMLVQEKNRSQTPNKIAFVIESSKKTVKFLEKQLDAIEEAIEKLLETLPEQMEKRKVLKSINGIGEKTSAALLGLLPELGRLNNKEIASLVGLAPHPCESGKYKGYRRTKGGRQDVRNLLYMGAMAASRSKSTLGDFYNSLINRGKKKKVALTALMRKMIVIANARLRDWFKSQESLALSE